VKTAGGGIAAGGIGLAKAGFLGKFFIYLFLWNGARTAFLLGGWIGIALIAAAIAAFVYYRRQRQAATS
jgi:NADH:ubiquinone oxidoreductase subunit 2 (subunit N)